MKTRSADAVEHVVGPPRADGIEAQDLRLECDETIEADDSVTERVRPVGVVSVAASGDPYGPGVPPLLGIFQCGEASGGVSGGLGARDSGKGSGGCVSDGKSHG